MEGFDDPIEDVNLLDFLFGEVLPASDDEIARVRSLQNTFRASG